MTSPRALAIAAALATGSIAAPASAVRLVAHSSGLADITTVTAPKNDARLFVTEQRGVIRVIPPGGGAPLATPYLNLTDRVVGSGEQGLLGLAFHPNFAINGKLFVNFTIAGGDTVVSEWKVANPAANVATIVRARRLMRIPQPYSNHNGGNLAFGPDGFLYIGMGDGGAGGDPGNRAQNLRTRLGKMLRIDVNGWSATLPYRIPKDNPYRGISRVPGEIYSSGLRNPWRFSFDRLRGDLWIGDVGQGAREEIDYTAKGAARGANFGWRTYEGRTTYSPSTPLGPGRLVWPVVTYGHGSGCSVTGGFVYRGPSITGLNGRYLFSDFCSAQIWSMRAGPTPGDLRNITSTLGASLSGVRTFGEGGNGALYVASGDRIWRFAN